MLSGHPSLATTAPPQDEGGSASRSIRWSRRLAAVIALLLCSWLLIPASAAHATSGHDWTKAAGLNGTNYFVGQYRNAEGQTAYCTDFEKLAPQFARDYDGRHSGAFVRSDGKPLSKQENAALSYLLNRWGATSNEETAAAVQLSVWAMTSPGMEWGSATMTELIKNEDLPSKVVNRAKSMSRTAQDNAGPYSVRIILGDGSGAGLISKAAVAVLGSNGSPVEGLEVRAHIAGAFTFADGRDTTSWTSSTRQRMLKVDRTTLASGQLSITVPQTPAPGVHWLEPDRSNAQRLLTASVLKPRKAASKLAALPAFQPKVTTETSAAKVEPGSQLHDVLDVSVAGTGQDSVKRWLHQPATGQPLSVEVVSTLWGPLDRRPGLSASVPRGTPKVGTVTTRVDGPGTYKTPSLTVAGPGYYVWTETIEPSSTQPQQAAQFVKPWQGKFGIAEETTLVPWRLDIHTKLSQREAVVGDSITDLVTVSGFAENASNNGQIRLTMYGPLDQRPLKSAGVPEGTPVFAENTVPARNGEHRSGAFATFAEPGCYTVVASFAGNETTLAHASAFGIGDETVCVSPKPPAESNADEPPEAGGAQPAATAPIPDSQPRTEVSAAADRQRLADTGASLNLLAAGGIMLSGLGLSCGILSWRRRGTV